jgi:hypothetical protein
MHNSLYHLYTWITYTLLHFLMSMTHYFALGLYHIAPYTWCISQSTIHLVLITISHFTSFTISYLTEYHTLGTYHIVPYTWYLSQFHNFTSFTISYFLNLQYLIRHSPTTTRRSHNESQHNTTQ